MRFISLPAEARLTIRPSYLQQNGAHAEIKNTLFLLPSSIMQYFIHCRKLEKEGYEVTYLDVHENGMVRLEEVEAAIRPDTCLCNNYVCK